MVHECEVVKGLTEMKKMVNDPSPAPAAGAEERKINGSCQRYLPRCQIVLRMRMKGI